MAINTQKLLPSSNSGALTKSSLSSSIVKSPIKEDLQQNRGNSLLNDIEIKVIEIDKILKGSVIYERKKLEQEKKENEEKKRRKREEKLEEKPVKDQEKKSKINLPRIGFLDRIKNFVGNAIIGYFAIRLLDHLPKLKGIVTTIFKITDFVIDLGGKLLNGLVTFIDWGYKAYDATRGFLKNLGGENFAKVFDSFNGAIGTLVEAAIIAALAFGDLGGGDGGGRPGRGGGYRNGVGTGQYNGFNTRTTRSGILLSRTGDALRAQRGDYSTSGYIKSEKDIMKRYFQKYGRDAFVQRFGQEGLERLPGGMARSGLTKFARRAFVGALGKGGAKAILGTVRPLLKRLPIIGALIDFGLSVALGEDPGRAAFKAIGAGLLGSVGTAVGSLAFGFGGIVGGILGSIGGDAVGGALYDVFFGNKKPQQKTVKAAGGGIIRTDQNGLTRGNKVSTGARRKITGITQKGKYKREIPKKPERTRIKGDKDDPIKKVGEELDKTKYFGPILAISSKIINEEKPTAKDYENAGLGINLLISKGIEEGQLKGGVVAAFAGGGLVNEEFLSAAERGSSISNWVAKTFQGEIESNAQKTLRLIKERRKMKEKEREQYEQSTSTTPAITGPVPGGQLTMEQLVGLAKGAGFNDSEAVTMAAIAMAESGGNSNAKNFKPPDKSYGLWQINMIGPLGPARMQEFGLQREDQLFDPLTNAKAAYSIRKSEGLSAWTVYKTGKYKNHLLAAQKAKNAPPLRSSPTPTIPGSSNGSKIAGELGRFMKQKGVVPGSIHRHPEHPPYSLTSGHSPGSLHYQGRAIDLGANDYEQGPVLNAVKEFNRIKGVTPVQLLHAGNDPSGDHNDHIHVAYGQGGFVRGMHKALIGERGVEFVLDTDTTRALEENFPGFLKDLNSANYQGAIQVLRNYADYEDVGGGSEIVMIPVPVSTPLPINSVSDVSIPSEERKSNPFKQLYVGG